MPIGTIQRMGPQADIQIQIAAAPAVEALAALARHSQPLAIACAFGYACLEGVRRAPHLSLRIVLGQVQIEIDLRTVIRVRDRDGYRDFIVLARHRYRSAAAATAAATAQTLEQIRQIQPLGGEWFFGGWLPLLLPLRRRMNFLSHSLRPELVVCRALVGILERLVRLGDFLEFFLRAGLFRDVRMILAREPAIGFFDLLLAGAARQPEDGVIVFVFHTYCRVAGVPADLSAQE